MTRTMMYKDFIYRNMNNHKGILILQNLCDGVKTLPG